MKSDNYQHLLAFVKHVVTAATHADLYGLGHDQTQRRCADALESVSAALSEGRETNMLILDGEIIVDGTPLEVGLGLERFAQGLRARGIGHIRLLPGVAADELNSFIAGMTKRALAREELRSTEHIRFGSVEVRFIGDGDGKDSMEGLRAHPSFAAMPKEELLRLVEIYEGVRRYRKLKMSGINEVVTSFIKIFKDKIDPLMTISPLKAIDEYTFTHSTNVCLLNVSQAMSLGMDGQLLHDIGVAGMMHDIGKLFIPEEIITKPGKLTEQEWDIVRQHPLKGAQYLLNTSGVPHLAAVVAFEHHMKYNQEGYPQVRKGWRQHPVSQMTAISDFFDATRTHRAYQESLDFDVVTSYLLDAAGTELHPLLVRNFVGMLRRTG